MLVALTGGTGLVGKLLVPALLRRGHRVRMLVRPRTDSHTAPPTDAAIEHVVGRLDELEPIERLVDGVDAILHAAFMHPESTMHPDSAAPQGRSIAEHYVQTNYAGTLRLLERTSSTRAGQLIYVSSLAIYGHDPTRDPRAERYVLDEDFPVRPPEFYGAMRAGVEAMCYAASQAYGLNVSIFRLGLVLGRRATFAETPCASSVVEAVRYGELRTPHAAYVIAAEDAAEILADAVGDARLRGQIYNTFDRWLDYGELVPLLSQILRRAVQRACPVVPLPARSIRADRIHARHAGFDTERALRELLQQLATEALLRSP